MADELKLFANPASDSGISVEAKVYTGLGVQVGNDVTCTEVGELAIYLGDMPTAGAGRYYMRFFNGDGALLSQAVIDWDGTQEVTPGNGIIENGITQLEAMRLILSALLGKVFGAGTSQMTFRDTADTKDRITAVVDAQGNRRVVDLDGS